MAALAWIALCSPALAVVVITILGERITRHTAGLLAAGSTLVSFVCTVAIFVDLLGRDPDDRSELTSLWTARMIRLRPAAGLPGEGAVE